MPECLVLCRVVAYLEFQIYGCSAARLHIALALELARSRALVLLLALVLAVGILLVQSLQVGYWSLHLVLLTGEFLVHSGYVAIHRYRQLKQLMLIFLLLQLLPEVAATHRSLLLLGNVGCCGVLVYYGYLSVHKTTLGIG